MERNRERTGRANDGLCNEASAESEEKGRRGREEQKGQCQLDSRGFMSSLSALLHVTQTHCFCLSHSLPHTTTQETRFLACRMG